MIQTNKSWASASGGGTLNSENGSTDRNASQSCKQPWNPDQSENLQASVNTGGTLNSESGLSDRTANLIAKQSCSLTNRKPSGIGKTGGTLNVKAV